MRKSMTISCVCLKCNSKDVSPNLSLKSIAIGTFQHEHICNKCGYEGIFPEVKKSTKK